MAPLEPRACLVTRCGWVDGHTSSYRPLHKTPMGTVAVLAMMTALAGAQELPSPPLVPRQSLDDAWWTGPMLAPSAATLPKGHFLIEPYVYDVIVVGHFDRDGVRSSAPASHGFGSLAYALYGLSDRLTVGLLPTAGYNTIADASSSSGVGIADLSLQGQYRLSQFHESSWVPTTSIVVEQTFPTGKYDRLGDRPTNGMGGGAYTTTLALYSQTYFWLPNGRILRARLDISGSFSSRVNVRDVSVYGTGEGFRGEARPGNSFFADGSFEYSLTRSWVLAVDLTYRHTANTRVSGYGAPVSHDAPNPPPIEFDLGSSDALGVAPAIEYSWKPNLGVLLGVRVIAAGRNTAATVTPAVAINIVF